MEVAALLLHPKDLNTGIYVHLTEADFNNFEDFFEKFVTQRRVFAANESGAFINSKTSNALNDYLQTAIQWFQSDSAGYSVEGSSNVYAFPWNYILKNDGSIVSGTEDDDRGVRVSKKNATDRKAQEHVVKEVIMTLKAVEQTLHPPVYACGFRNQLTVYVVKNCISFERWLNTPLSKKESMNLSAEAMATSTMEQLRKASVFGILMTDIKAKNMVIDTADKTVKFIDLGADMTVIFPTDDDRDFQSCLLFVNCILLLNTMTWWPPKNDLNSLLTVSKPILSFIKQQQPILIKYEGEGNAKDSLCKRLLMRGSTKNYYIDKYEQLEGGGIHIPPHILNMLKHYSQMEFIADHMNGSVVDQYITAITKRLDAYRQRLENQGKRERV